MKDHGQIWQRSGRVGAIVLLIMAVCAPLLYAGDEAPPVNGKNSSIQLSGVAWVAYRYKVADDPIYEAPGSLLGAAPKASPHEAAGRDLKSASSFDLDRVYVTGDYNYNPRYTWETVLEGSNQGGTLSLFVKKAFLLVKQPFDIKGSMIRAGQFGHPLVEQEVDAWGYRSVSRTAIDRYLGVSSVWAGVEGDIQFLHGALDADGMVANAKAYNAPDDTLSTVSSKYKNFMGKLTVTPLPDDPQLKGARLVLYAQYTGKDAPPASAKNHWTFTGPSAKNNHTLWFGGFPYWKTDRFTVGAEFLTRDDVTLAQAIKSRYIGGFGSVALTKTDRVFARIDLYDPNIDANVKNDSYTVVMLGGSHQLVKGVRTILDAEYDHFEAKAPDGSNSKPDLTVTARAELSL